MLNLNQLKKLYTNSPTWVRSIYSSVPFWIRNGSEYREWSSFLNTNLNVDEYEILKLKETILYAYENTKYYKDLFDDNQINPYAIHTKRDLQGIPLLTKKLIRENLDSLQVTNYPNSKKFSITTGGTTGYPVAFYQSENIWKKELAFVYDYFSQHGYKPSMLKASFKIREFKHIDKRVFWEKDYVNNSIHFSPIHLNRYTVSNYVQKLNELKPLFFHMYPSNLLLLINSMIDENLTLNYQLHGIFLVSEGYSTDDVNKIKRFFNCNVSSFYGHSERALFARAVSSELDVYQVDKRYGCFELMDENGFQVTQEGISGSIIGTTFDNYAMPLIRCETDDLTEYIDYKSDKINMIDSLRNHVYIDGINGVTISITAFSISKSSDKISIWQLYQKQAGQLTVLVVAKKNFTDFDKDKILLPLKKDFGNFLHCDLKLIDQPFRTARGKIRRLIKDY
ncbi:MAG: hypothetical protein U9N42_04500 [Campylobacterota bacterium]|nr:hypothetical protein [Campylobacterota bacterium]